MMQRKIAYAALLKLTPNSEYTDSANQWFLEAELIFGTVSNQVTAVRQAWANVGIEITQTTEDSPEDSDDGSGSGEDSQPEEDGGPSRDIPIPPGDDVVIYLVAQDGSTGSGENPVDEQYDVMLYNSDQNPDGFVEEANLGPLNEFPAAYIRPAVATLPSERTLVLYVRDSTKQLYYTYSDEIGEPDYILDFGEGVSVKSVAVSRGGSRLAVVFSEYKAYIYVYDIVSEEWSTYDIREPNYIPDDPGTLVDRVDAINFDPQGGSLIFDYQVCRAELDTDTCTELWSIGLVKLSTGIVDFPFIGLQDPNIDIANPRYSQKTYEAIVLDYIDFSNYEAEGKASSAVLALTSDGTSAIINPNQSESFDRALGYPSFVGEDESVLVQARFDDSIYLYSVPIDQDYQPSNESANSVIPFSAALSAAHVNVFVNTRTVLGINTELIELGEVIKGKEITAYFAIGNLGNSDILVTNVVPSSEEITTQLANTSLIPGEQKSFYVTVKTNNLDLGDYSGSISIEHDADNPAITLDISAVVTSGEEGSEDDLLAAPSNLSASDGADEASVFLTWSAVENADEYRVYWSDEEDGRKRRLTTIDYAPSNNNALSHTTGTDATFYYWVTGLNGEIESTYSNMDTGYAGEPRDPGDGSDGDGSDENSDSTATVDFALNYSVSVSVFQGCAIEDSGVRCWGNTDWLDYTGYPSFSSPSQITSGSAHACVLDQNSVVCWGYNGNGETDVPALNKPYFVASKYGISCALDESGVVCWGDNSSGQTDVPSLSNPREVAIGVENACALDDNGVVCWGDDSRAVSTNIPETVNPSKLTMGDRHACVTDNDRVVCWGSGFSPSNSSSPTYEQPTLVNPRKLVAGGYHVCALDDHGLKCWGRNNESQLEIPILINPSSVYAAGQFGSCALDDNGLQCWGSEVSDTNSEKERSLKEFPSDLSFASSGQRVVTQYLQTTSASENITTLNVVNTSDRSQTFRGILRSSSGEKVGVDQPVLGTDIPAMGRLTLNSDDLEAIFGIEAWKGPAMLTIKGDSTFDLMSKLESPSGLVSNTNCIRDNRVLNLEGFDSNNMSYVRLINTGAKTTQAIKGTLYDGNGIVVGNANAELVAKLDPYQQTWINRNQLSSLVDAEWNGEGMLEVNATPGLKLLNLNFITDEATFFNFSCADKATLLAEPSSSSGPANIGRIYLQTTSTSQNVSLTHLVNTSDSGQQYTGTLYGSDGAQVGSADQPLHSGTIASKGRLILSSADIESAFNISPWRGPAILEVKGDGLFELMTKLESPSGLISNTNCVRTEQVHNIGGFDQTDVTYVRFINIGDTPITNIRGSLYDDGGIVVGEANPVLVDELPAKSHVWRNRNQLSDTIGNTWNGTASLKIDNADSNLRLLNLNFINSETFFNFSCYETGQ